MICSVGAGGTARRYCRECGDPLPQTMAAEAVFCSGRCRSRLWRRLQRTRQRVAAMQRGEQAECPVWRSWTVWGRRRRCTARAVAGCGLPPAASVTERRYGNAIAERLEHLLFCRVVGGDSCALRAPLVHALLRRVALASRWMVTGVGAPLTGHVLVAGPGQGEGGGLHDRCGRPDWERQQAALQLVTQAKELIAQSPAHNSPWVTWRWRSSR
jgi:predicted nucleic acid-binding Zn ribbon protein